MVGISGFLALIEFLMKKSFQKKRQKNTIFSHFTEAILPVFAIGGF